jgi:hypothetical protein
MRPLFASVLIGLPFCLPMLDSTWPHLPVVWAFLRLMTQILEPTILKLKFMTGQYDKKKTKISPGRQFTVAKVERLGNDDV